MDIKALEKEGMHSVRWHEDWESFLSLSHRPTLFPLLPFHAQAKSGHHGAPGMESSLAGASTGKTEDGKVRADHGFLPWHVFCLHVPPKLPLLRGCQIAGC